MTVKVTYRDDSVNDQGKDEGSDVVAIKTQLVDVDSVRDAPPRKPSGDMTALLGSLNEAMILPYRSRWMRV